MVNSTKSNITWYQHRLFDIIVPTFKTLCCNSNNFCFLSANWAIDIPCLCFSSAISRVAFSKNALCKPVSYSWHIIRFFKSLKPNIGVGIYFAGLGLSICAACHMGKSIPKTVSYFILHILATNPLKNLTRWGGLQIFFQLGFGGCHESSNVCHANISKLLFLHWLI